ITTEGRMLNEHETAIICLNQIFPLKHLNLMFQLDRQLDICLKDRYIDIRNIVRIVYGCTYESDKIQAYLNTLRQDTASGGQLSFVVENLQEIINDYSNRDVHWGCGITPRRIADENAPGRFRSVSFCEKHLANNSKVSVQAVDADKDYELTDCNVSREERYTGRETSYGIIISMYNCGIIISYDELYRSESTIRVLHHLFETLKQFTATSRVPKYLIYDNACGLWLTLNARIKNKKIIETSISQVIHKMTFVVDKYHIQNHKRDICQKETNPKTYPELEHINTQVCEQTNAKLKYYGNAGSSYSEPTSAIFYLLLFHQINCDRLGLSIFDKFSEKIEKDISGHDGIDETEIPTES
ncbi:unnamed protein product, partial [Didymodactylos carnosus]